MLLGVMNTEGPLTIMAVHAHPDDEASSTGGILAKYAADPLVRTVLVTCTNGELGDAAGSIKPGEDGHDESEVVKVRIAELKESCSILGVDHLELLGYHDSGMMGWDANNLPGCFWNTPVETAAAKLAQLMDKYRPQVVVTYDSNGFYGHPDHIQAHRITVSAARSTQIPSKVYSTAIPKSAFAEFPRMLKEAGVELPEGAGPTQEDLANMGTPDAEITTYVDVVDYTDAKYDALCAHASQTDNTFFLQMGRDAFKKIFGIEMFVRMSDASGAPTPEDDLFAGLR